MQRIGVENIALYEEGLRRYCTNRLAELGDIRFIGTAPAKAAVVSFLVGNSHPYDVGVLLDHQGVAVRTGHHCTQPIMDHFHIPGTVRASFAIYNTTEEIDAFIQAVERAKGMLM